MRSDASHGGCVGYLPPSSSIFLPFTPSIYFLLPCIILLILPIIETQSSFKVSENQAGEWRIHSGPWYGHEDKDRGISTMEDSKFYTLYAPLDKAFKNEGKDLVVQFSVKHAQEMDCGGGYIKLMPSSNTPAMMADLDNNTPYTIMFGPDICGMQTRRVHAILSHRGDTHLIKEEVVAPADVYTHIYTFHLRPDNTYSILIDGDERQSGSLEEDWDMIEPKEIVDNKAKKPSDWSEDPMIDDPNDTKPPGWDEIPKEIIDPSARQPPGWDEDEDGEWEPPIIPNPEYKGTWRARRISNPEYKGPWSAPMIPNPNYKPDPKLYVRDEIGWVAFELWQVKSGSVFDNIIVTDSMEEATAFREETFPDEAREEERKMKHRLHAAEHEDPHGHLSGDDYDAAWGQAAPGDFGGDDMIFGSDFEDDFEGDDDHDEL